MVLEIGSRGGELLLAVAQRYPQLVFQPSDRNMRFFPLLEENRFATIESHRRENAKTAGNERFGGMPNFLRPAALEYTSVRWYQPKMSVMLVLMVDIIQLLGKVDVLKFFLSTYQTLAVGGVALIISPFLHNMVDAAEQNPPELLEYHYCLEEFASRFLGDRDGAFYRIREPEDWEGLAADPADEGQASPSGKEGTRELSWGLHDDIEIDAIASEVGYELVQVVSVACHYTLRAYKKLAPEDRQRTAIKMDSKVTRIMTRNLGRQETKNLGRQVTNRVPQARRSSTVPWVANKRFEI